MQWSMLIATKSDNATYAVFLFGKSESVTKTKHDSGCVALSISPLVVVADEQRVRVRVRETLLQTYSDWQQNSIGHKINHLFKHFLSCIF